MLVGGVVDHQLGNYPHAARMRFGDESPGVAERAVFRMNATVIRDVIAIVAARRGIERQQPHGGDAELRDVVQLF